MLVNSRIHRKLRPLGFTLVELLVVMGIVGLLAAILLPVFAQVRENSRRSACASNLRQLGLATQLYAQDANDEFPYGGDPCDLYTSGWSSTPYALEVAGMDPLNEVLAPYVHSPDLWHCPSDTGYTVCSLAGSVHLTATPTAYEDYGMSYSYNTNLTLHRQRLSTVTATDPHLPYTVFGPADIILLGDTNGAWHSGQYFSSPRFNVLFVDGHAASLTQDKARYAWSLVFPKS